MGRLINGEKIDFRKDFDPEIGCIKECKRNFSLWGIRIGAKYMVLNSYTSYGMKKCTVKDVTTGEEHQISVQCFDK